MQQIEQAATSLPFCQLRRDAVHAFVDLDFIKHEPGYFGLDALVFDGLL